MGYTSKEILDDINRGNPLPSTGKITKQTKQENANKSLDAALTDDQYKAAKFIYDIITSIYKVDNIQDLYDPKLEAVNSKALETLTESSKDEDKPTASDILYKKICKRFASDNKSYKYIYANRVLQFFVYDISELFKQAKIEQPPLTLFDGGKLFQMYLKDTIEQTKFIRAANHLLMLEEGKSEYQANAFLESDLKDNYESFKKVFKEVGINFEKNTMNEDVSIGVDVYVINAFVNLINKVATVDGKKFNIKRIVIPKDLVAPEKEKAIQSGNIIFDLLKKTKIGSFVGNMAKKAVNKVVNSTGIGALAKKLTESNEIKDEVIQAIAEEYPEFEGKTFKDLEEEWKTDHCKQLDKRDKDFLTNAMGIWTSGEALKKYWDETENLTTFFDVISRQLYYASDKKQTLYIWDEKQDYLCTREDDQFSKYVNNIEFNNREQDDEDMEQYESNRYDSNIDDYVDDYQDDLENSEDEFDEQFEAKFPSVKDAKSLAKIVDVIANAKPLDRLVINDELGVCYPTKDLVDQFKYYQSRIASGVIESYRSDIYSDLNEFIIDKVSIKEAAIQISRYLNESC